MTLCFTLVLGLFLLAPGLAAFVGLYHRRKLGSVKAPPPPPASILALSIVIMGAVVAHLIGALLFWLRDTASGVSHCIHIDYGSNV